MTPARCGELAAMYVWFVLVAIGQTSRQSASREQSLLYRARQSSTVNANVQIVESTEREAILQHTKKTRVD